MRSLSPEPVSFLQQAPSNSTAWQAYNAGVKMGCWGLVIYAATGAICSGERSPGAAVRPRVSCPFKQGRLSHGDRIMETRASSQGKATGGRYWEPGGPRTQCGSSL